MNFMLLPIFLAFVAADLSPQKVPKLSVAWTYQTGAMPPNRRAAAIAAFEATPVLAEGLLYVITPFNEVIALDPESGAQRWRYDPKIAADREYSEATARGVAVSRGRIFFGTLDARLIALNSSTGRLVWQTKLDAASNDGNYQVTSPPVVAGDTVIVGSSVGDNSRAQMDRGTVRAYSVNKGALKWTWDPTPPGKTGAANAWAPLSADAERDMVILPTGSASPDFYGGLRPGDNKYANSVVALQASTGKLLWSFQVVHHDLWDYDVASRPELIDFQGKPAVGVVTKMGHYFALDRMTGTPLLPVEEKPVPHSDVEGESAWPTQPFPRTACSRSRRLPRGPGGAPRK